MIRKVLLLGAIVLVFGSCSSLRRGSSRMNESPFAEGVKEDGIEIREEHNSGTTKTDQKEQPAIVVREEKVRTVDVKETSENIYHYYVIIGSFRYLENAKNYKETLIKKGFVPIVLENEKGLFRVSVAAYNEEDPARRNIGSIRENYPEYSDVWLLIRKQ
ncbi:SPOR domain-containing protein [Thermophagus sp. OGC60D27]|uniref:SPOR domain-containing protein n=1 Tax=Thermophagus sp. OGC60D27 TaxID=3458415 RepID=UPI00403795E7